MASVSQTQPPSLDHLSDDILQCILDVAMTRDSPFYLDNPRPRQDRDHYKRRKARDDTLESSKGEKDPNYTGTADGIPQHHRALQSDHVKDWIFINSTSHRIRRLGKTTFFRQKTIAMHLSSITLLHNNDPDTIKGMAPEDQTLILRYVRDIIIIDPQPSSPNAWLTLPKLLCPFSRVNRCTLLLEFKPYSGMVRERDGVKKEDGDHADWITAAFVLGAVIPPEMQEYLTGIGMPRTLKLEEAMACGTDWRGHRDMIAKSVYPILRLRIELLGRKKKMDVRAAS
ncbi:hypothetical protein EJ08DRAFT_653810 [Tothia fuscella]|uniref:Uncharacterized protein n=1 Tax=Tothia fuscella TaxID=1048955 RepID=A0A9P4NGP8_9PEZI|nr:hypothetical protein EJ08DRAFT_653810 [Tothia fuscella]